MIEFVSETLLATLFPEGVGGAGALRVTEPVPVDDAIEASGIDFDGIRYLVSFADVMTYAGHDEQFVRETAAAWNGAFLPAPNSRLVKFFRAEADRETMFYPANGRCPVPR